MKNVFQKNLTDIHPIYSLKKAMADLQALHIVEGRAGSVGDAVLC